MSNERTTLEIIAPTIEDAIQKGLEQLNMIEDEVDVEVLDSGSRGLFGIGSRQARVRLTVRGEGPVDMDEPSRTSSPAKTSTPLAATLVERPAVQAEVMPADDEELSDGDILGTARQTVMELLEKMKIDATVTAAMKPAEDDEDEPAVLVNIEGDDLSILIGRRSETLNALQYITSMIVGKRLNHWTPLLIDVQGYRARRERQLRVLARRMADQAVHTGRRQVLEPMPSNERRVIHLELRDHPQVETESIGDDPNRKVTIILKK
jgi:spoIIIJ-associated protein